MRRKYLLLSAASVLFGLTATAQTSTQNEWTSYCGWHYGNTPAWGGWVRDYVQHSTGFDLVDFTGPLLAVDTVKLNNLFSYLSTIDTDVDILQLDGGLGQAKDTVKAKSFINMIEADSAAFWKSLVYRQCNKLAQLPNSQYRLYYQLGNEITSAALSSSIRYAMGMPYSSGSDYDISLIPYFVEQYMAPTIEAIDSASVHSFGAKGKINICLGSITNAGNNAALPYTEALLNYTITGTNAPSLAGKKVYELVNIITIHYMMGNSSANVWQNRINGYLGWVGTGRIKGVWSTEEVGIQKATAGAGAAYSARATFRYLKTAIDNNYASDVVRTNYWAWENGPGNTQVNDFNSELYDFLGDVKLKYVDPIGTGFPNSANLESYGFLNSASNTGVLAIMASSSSVSQINLHKQGWGNVSAVSLTRYNTDGNFDVPVTLNTAANSTTITFPEQILTLSDVLLLKVSTSFPTPQGPSYPPPSGVYCSCGPTTGQGSGSVAPDIASKPFVKGILVRVGWDLVEPSDDSYNWGLIDDQIAAAKSYGKKVSLGVGCGKATPQWVYTAGAQKLTSSHPVLGNISLPVPWDAVFLQKWTDFIAQFGDRYQTDTTVTLVYVTNSTANGFEMQEPPVVSPSWTSVGYSDTKMVDSWKAVLDAFSAAFPNHYIANDFHPVNGSDVVADSVYVYGRQLMPNQYGAAAWWWTQHNTTVYPQQYEILQHSAQNAPFTGVQMANNGTSDSTAFGPGGMPAALQLAIDDGVCYWELWNQDILNPDFEDLLSNAACVAPAAGFTVSQSSGCAPFTVQFDNTSSGANFTWEWSFEGGMPSSSTSQNPSSTFSQPGEHTVTLIASANGMEYTFAQTINVLPAAIFNLQGSICSGEIYEFNGETLTTSGNYTGVYTSYNGCDSTVTLTLDVLPSASSTQQASICEGETYPFNGEALTTSGNHTAVYTSYNGCDSTVTLILDVLPTASSTQQASICEGETYPFNGEELTTSGTYTAVYNSSNGCDSIVTLILDVLPSGTNNLMVIICEGENYQFNGQTLTIAGDYNFTINGSNGCDATVILSLTVLPTASSTQQASICEGETYPFNGEELTTSGTYTAVYNSYNGCDSTMTLILDVLPTASSTQQASICEGETYPFNGEELTTSGTYTAVYNSYNGCDSTVTLILDVLPTASSTQQASICEGETYPFNGEELTTSGTYTAVYNSYNGCDSTVTLTLEVLPLAGSTQQASICEGEAYPFNGEEFSSSGTYTAVYNSSNGCDSTVTLTLEVIPFPIAEFTYSVLDSEVAFTNNSSNALQYLWDFGDGSSSTVISPTHEYSASGEFNVTLMATNDCGTVSFHTIVTLLASLVQDNDVKPSMVIYPNPNKGIFTLKLLSGWGKNAHFALFDSMGRLISKTDKLIQFENELDYSGLPAGPYHLKINLANSAMVHILLIVVD
ncbi:MAG: PKD domain-containing protein [Bacteroidetes bacterium]|nr:PKD domain-containing protein [Bacteroidota bacterium]